ncbi:MAG: (2Fe-2S)-binding protein [Rhodospirillales bacterium]|nr:(2Fe-2S)-binding protein [Rhodospirillales bacterium]
MTAFTLSVNGKTHEIDTDPAKPLVYVLRGELGLTGPKIGCALEQCAACAVLVDGEHTLSCNRAASEFEGKQITTIEGLSEDALGAQIQTAFMEENAAQCGYCTPGIVIAVASLLKTNASPDRGQITEALGEHLCRCGSHNRVLRAITSVIEGGANNG